MSISKLTFFLLVPLSFFTCAKENGGIGEPGQGMPSEVISQPVAPSLELTNVENSVGINYVEARRGRGKVAYRQLMDMLDRISAIGVVADVDHAANAGRFGFDLPYTRTVLFGNPRLGTPLMQINQRVGLDLPQKITIYEYGQNDVLVGYNNVDYLDSRHRLGNPQELNVISGTLRKIAEDAGNNEVIFAANSTVPANAGIREKTTTTRSVDQVYAALRSAVTNNPNLSVIAELDHRANAASVNLELRPTRLIVFGNPALGTPLLQAERTVSLDLPQKILVYEDAAGTVHLIYNDPTFLAERHGFPADLPEIGVIATALENLATTAIGG